MALASSSPRRRELLTSLGLVVDLLPTSYAEAPQPARTPFELAQIHARGKLESAPAAPVLTVAADTVVDLDGQALGKPGGDAAARAMLTALSGREHRVHTAFALRAPSGETLFDVVSTRVWFAALDDAIVEAYVAGGDGRDKAGAYGIQGFGATLIERIEGDYFTVVGFPLAAFARALPRLGYRLLPLPARRGAVLPLEVPT